MRSKKITYIDHFEGYVTPEYAYETLSQKIVNLGCLPKPGTFVFEREVEDVDSISLHSPLVSVQYVRASLESFGD